MVDTICALSTPPGRSALALIRISGPSAYTVIGDMGADDVSPRSPSLRILKDGAGQPLDEVVITYFKSPHSYTGEDLVEISCHGNPSIVRGIIDEIVSRETIRLAEPGEFTSRALAHGKLSLDQVESLDWILNSETLAGARRGLQSKLSGLSKVSEQVRLDFMGLLSDLQSQLDFSDTDVGGVDRGEISERILALSQQLKGWADSFAANRHLLDRWVVVLAGPPNSGKSSLFNSLVREDRAIVFDQPGTTRDYLAHPIEVDGVQVLIIDTAGVRSNPEPIEKIGIEKTLEAMSRADVICWVDEAGREPGPDLKDKYSKKRWLWIRSKADLECRNAILNFMPVSALTGDGVTALRTQILPEARNNAVDWTPLTSDRQRGLVEKSAACLERAYNELREGGYLDMVTEHLLAGVRAIDALVDAPQTDDVLRVIFSRFCIGK